MCSCTPHGIPTGFSSSGGPSGVPGPGRVLFCASVWAPNLVLVQSDMISVYGICVILILGGEMDVMN